MKYQLFNYMEEQLITLECAKLAKEKGFNIPTLFRYQGNHNAGLEYIDLFDEIGEEQVSESQFGYVIKGSTHNDDSYLVPRLSAPTQALLQKWIREKHDIQLFVAPIGAEPIGYVAIVPKCYIGKGEPKNQGVFNTYEEALEAALIQALNFIES